MKYFNKFFFLSLIFCFFAYSIFLSKTTFAVESEVVSTMSVQVYGFTLDKTAYKVGEEIKGRFVIQNHSSFPLFNISYRTAIATDYEEPIPGTKVANTFLDAHDRTGSITLSAGEKKTIDFVYKVPQFVSGEKLAISTEVYSEAGNSISFGDSPYFKVEKTVPLVTILNSGLVLSNGNKFDLTEGPTIYEAKEPSSAFIEITLKSASKSSIILNPSLKVYEQKDIDNIENVTLEKITLGAGETKTVKLALPVMSYKPGVYFAELLLQDIEGVQVVSRVGARYIVGGNIATIHNVSLDRTALNKNDEFIFSAKITGRPFDITILNTPNPVFDLGQGKVEISVFNEGNKLVASNTEVFNVAGETSIKSTLKAQNDANALRVEMKVFDETGKLLTEYKNNLSLDYEEKSLAYKPSPLEDKNILIIAGAALLLFVMIISLMIKKGISGRIGMLSLFVLGGLAFTPNFASASCVGVDARVTPVSPYRMEIFDAGEEFYVSGKVYYTSCNNSATDVYLTVTGPKGDKLTKKYSKGATGGRGSHWSGNNGVFLLGPFKAPDTAGQYDVKFYVKNVSGRFDDCVDSQTVIVPIVVETPKTGGGGGCPSGSYYCELTKSCIPDSEMCNPSNPIVLDPPNPEIPRDSLGPVALKALELSPSIVNQGDACIIKWGNAFKSYDRYTMCTFSGPQNIGTFTFPVSTTDKTEFRSKALQSDTMFKMSCYQVDDTGATIGGTTRNTDAVCRVNLNYKEVN